MSLRVIDAFLGRAADDSIEHSNGLCAIGLNELEQIWLAANLPCSKRLKAILPIWLPGYVELFGELTPDVTKALLKISPPTIDRMLKPIRYHYTKRGRRTTKPGTLLRNQIWMTLREGFLTLLRQCIIKSVCMPLLATDYHQNMRQC